MQRGFRSVRSAITVSDRQSVQGQKVERWRHVWRRGGQDLGGSDDNGGKSRRRQQRRKVRPSPTWYLLPPLSVHILYVHIIIAAFTLSILHSPFRHARHRCSSQMFITEHENLLSIFTPSTLTQDSIHLQLHLHFHLHLHTHPSNSYPAAIQQLSNSHSTAIQQPNPFSTAISMGLTSFF